MKNIIQPEEFKEENKSNIYLFMINLHLHNFNLKMLKIQKLLIL